MESSLDQPVSKNASQEKEDDDTVVKLNVGGRLFETRKSTLRKYCDSFFGAMFSGNYASTPNCQGEYFIDRSPKNFEVILSFLRDGRVIIPSKLNPLSIQDDAKFYGLYEQMFGAEQEKVLICTSEKEYDLVLKKDQKVFVGEDETLRVVSIEGNGIVILNTVSIEDKPEITDITLFDSRVLEGKEKKIPMDKSGDAYI